MRVTKPSDAQDSGTYVVTTVKGLSDPLNLRSVQDKNALAFASA